MVDPFLPDLSFRQSSVTLIIPLFLNFYAMAVLAILPNTFLFKLLLHSVLVWQVWRCLADVDFSAWLAQSLKLESTDSINFWNSVFAFGMLIIVLRSFEWTFIIKEPLRKDGLTTDQNVPEEQRFSISKVLLDAFDLLCNLRGIGWSWSQKSPQWLTAPPPEPIPFVFASFLFCITMFDASRYLMMRVSPIISSSPHGGSIFDPNLDFIPRNASATFAGICGGVWTYSLIETVYRSGVLVGRVILRQPASHWPPISHRPWLSTSLHEFWSFRWHQLFRHLFIVFGARPGGALLGRPGAFVSAFAVSAVFHYFAVWGMGSGSEFSTIGGFFLLMGVGAALEIAFTAATGTRVQGFGGWLWTMSWITMWGTLLIDAWARHGLLASEFFPERLRPGKALVDAIIGLPA